MVCLVRAGRGTTATVMGYPIGVMTGEMRAERITINGKQRSCADARGGGTGWLVWLEGSAVAVAMRQWLWLYPMVEIVHIIGFVILVGAAAMFDLRLLGLRTAAGGRSGQAPIALGALSLLLVIPSGVLMFMAHALRWLKIPPSVSNYC